MVRCFGPPCLQTIWRWNKVSKAKSGKMAWRCVFVVSHRSAERYGDEALRGDAEGDGGGGGRRRRLRRRSDGAASRGGGRRAPGQGGGPLRHVRHTGQPGLASDALRSWRRGHPRTGDPYPQLRGRGYGLPGRDHAAPGRRSLGASRDTGDGGRPEACG